MSDPKTPSPSERILATRRNFLKKAGLGGAAAATGVLASPANVNAPAPIRGKITTTRMIKIKRQYIEKRARKIK